MNEGLLKIIQIKLKHFDETIGIRLKLCSYIVAQLLKLSQTNGYQIDNLIIFLSILKFINNLMEEYN